MLKRLVPDLFLHSIPAGTGGDGRDLKRFLYRGAAGNNGRRDVNDRIARGEFGPPLIERLELLKLIHARIEDAPISSHGKLGWYGQVSRFVQWIDRLNDAPQLTVETGKAHFVEYADHLQHRVRIAKTLKPRSAYTAVCVLANVLGPILDPDAPRADRALRDLASTPKPGNWKRSCGIQGNKQRLDYTFQFGSFLSDICAELTTEAVQGPMPLRIAVVDGTKTLDLSSRRFNLDLRPEKLLDAGRRKNAIRAREPLPPDVDAKDARPWLINLRIHAEMLIFIAQTSMNLAQVKNLPRADYRWQTQDQDYIVLPVYKARRHGVARFIVFRAYRDHFNRYLGWLDALGLNENDDRLFPCVYAGHVPPAYALPTFCVLRKHCKKLGVHFVGPRLLRSTRINWLLRRSRDPSLTAEMAAHTKETLLRVYEEGDLQSASQEIGAYHAKTDPSLSQPRTTPACLRGKKDPDPLPGTPKEAPQPDCVTPEGCLWCDHFRDVLAPDYCWRLTSHRHLKSLEVALFKPPASRPIHPGYLVIDRLCEKLNAIAARSQVCADWVKEAEDKVREGEHHPQWANLIEVVEDLV